jgi:hypothetical protein
MSEEVREMSDNSIMSEFEELFGSNSEEDETNDSNENTSIEDETEDESEDESEDDENEEESEDKEESEEGDSENESDDEGDKSKKSSKGQSNRAKQNYAFAELRTKAKKQENLIRSLGKVIGLDSDTPVEDVVQKVEELIIKKEAKDANVPEELYTRLKQLESMAQESEKVKREKSVSDAFIGLSEKYSLTNDELVEFASTLSENGKNPLEVNGVDIESEYLKLHQQDIINKAVQQALAAETDRQKKVEDHASSSSKSGRDPGNEAEIKSVSDLDKMFSELDL